MPWSDERIKAEIHKVVQYTTMNGVDVGIVIDSNVSRLLRKMRDEHIEEFGMSQNEQIAELIRVNQDVLDILRKQGLGVKEPKSNRLVDILVDPDTDSPDFDDYGAPKPPPSIFKDF